MIDRVGTEKCSLCGSCINACPVHAITFAKHYRGFCYPVINSELCISCNKCENACPACNAPQVLHEQDFPIGYIGRNPQKAVRLQSTSGGIFLALAESVLHEHGYVCGAIMDDSFNVKHVISEQWDVITRMTGSKYVQSNVEGIYTEIKKILNEGRIVLFTGCPCQIAGLRTYLGNAPENLYLVELVCHGIPGNEMLQSYIGLQEKKNNSSVKTIEFRNKDNGWHSSAVKIEFENGSYYLEPITVDAYMNGFLGGVTLKECCYDCQYKAFRAGSDLILGDFWGAEVEMSDVDDNTGLSAILAMSEKGRSLLECVKIEMWDIDVDTIIKYNQNILKSTTRSPLREDFYKYVETGGTFEKAIEKYLWEKNFEKVKRKTTYGLRYIYYKLTGKGKPLY